jgi:hypothetical protein
MWLGLFVSDYLRYVKTPHHNSLEGQRSTNHSRTALGTKLITIWNNYLEQHQLLLVSAIYSFQSRFFRPLPFNLWVDPDPARFNRLL